MIILQNVGITYDTQSSYIYNEWNGNNGCPVSSRDW